MSFTSAVAGSTSVGVWLSRATPVTCDDGAEDFRTESLGTASDEATSPGPVTLDVDRRLRTAVGDAVVDLVLSTSPGCGQLTTTSELGAQRVRIVVEGTTVRFRTGFTSRTSSRSDADVLRSLDFSRDGVGTASVGSFVTDAGSVESFLKYAVDRSLARGSVGEPPPNAAPAGGLGAMGVFSREGAPGAEVAYEDAWVTGTIGAAPGREEWASASAWRVVRTTCAGGEDGEVVEFVDGGGPAHVTINTQLSRAEVAGTVPATRFSLDGCTGVETVDTVDVPVTLSLEATGAAVRSVGDQFQVRPSEGVRRERVSYVARPAGGELSVGDVSGAPDLASISRAGR